MEGVGEEYRSVFLEERYLIVMKKKTPKRLLRRVCNSIAIKTDKSLFYCFPERERKKETLKRTRIWQACWPKWVNAH